MATNTTDLKKDIGNPCSCVPNSKSCPHQPLTKCLTCPIQVVTKILLKNGGKCYSCSPPITQCKSCGVQITFGQFIKHSDTCSLRPPRLQQHSVVCSCEPNSCTHQPLTNLPFKFLQLE